MKKPRERITVGDLIKALSAYDKDLEVDFSCLDNNRLKQRSPTIPQVEFHQMVYRDDEGNVVVDNLE